MILDAGLKYNGNIIKINKFNAKSLRNPKNGAIG